jgi:bacterioferritin-associated ferredoxin
LSRELGVATGCGQCACFASEMLDGAPAGSGAMTGVRQAVHPDAA